MERHDNLKAIAQVAIIIPTYNRADRVLKAIASALEQSHPAIRVIVVDDGSSDATSQVLESLNDARLTVMRHDVNKGASAAKNTGLSGLRPDDVYFGILDSDDTLRGDAVRQLVAVFDKHPGDYSMVFGWCESVPARGPTGEMTHRTGSINYDDALSGAFSGEFWQICRSDLLRGMRFDSRAIGCEGSLWWRFLRQRPAFLIPDVVRKYDVSGSDRVSLLRNTVKDAKGRMYACLSLIEAVGDDLRDRYPERFAMLSSETAKWAILAESQGTARAAARAAFRSLPSVRSAMVVAVAILPSLVSRSIVMLRGRAGGQG